MRLPLILNGFMATGKSTIGRRVAERTRTEFVDLDARVSEVEGATVATLFAERGEAHFRQAEQRELERLLGDGKPRVIAVGGGALVPREVRLRALERAVVVSLEASPEEIATRAARQGGRPLLEVADPLARIRELLEARSLAYKESHARISTDQVSVEDVAERVLSVWRRQPVAVALGSSSYTVEIGSDITAGGLPNLMGSPSAALLISDSNVFPLHGGGVRAALERCAPRVLVEVLPPGEEHKLIGSVERIWRRALEGGADRKSVFFALGGGVVTDMAGFAAASWMRGVGWASAPTTLLSQVDASVGGKTGVDLGSAKNAVGAFWQPQGVLCDVAFLRTESERGYRSGLAEVVKSALIGDTELLALLEDQAPAVIARDPAVVTDLVRRSIQVKASIVSRDEREGGLRAVLNLGHTVGHALESCAGYDRLTHGEAVSLGLVAALEIGIALGETPPALRDRVVALLRTLGLPVDLSQEPLALAADLLGHDKKRAGAELTFIVARAPGQVERRRVAVRELRDRVLALA